tara:strand:+ start:179 stop:355 length:177 start_codon:yes stop_codon:yes gene_type:complete
MGSLDDTYETTGNDLKMYGVMSPENEKALYTERRRRVEDKLEMLRIKLELGIEDDFTF